MNQVHKVIWSRVKNCYIVVSEITKRVGRDNKASVTGIRPLRALLCAMVIAGCMLPADADAAPGLIHAGTGATASGDSSIAYGYSAQAKKDHSIAQGTGADAEEEYALAMGYKAIAKGLQSLAIGRQANAIGNNSIAQAQVPKDTRRTVWLSATMRNRERQTIRIPVYRPFCPKMGWQWAIRLKPAAVLPFQ